MSKNSVSPKSAPEAPDKLTTIDGTKNLFLLYRVTGILMPERYKVLYVIYSLIFNISTVIIVPVLFFLSYFMTSEKMQINQFITSVQTCVSTYTCEIKFCILVFMRPYLLKFEVLLDKLNKRTHHPEEIRETLRIIKFSNRLIVIFSVFYYSYSFVTLLESSYYGRPPFSLYNPFLDWRKSSTNLAIASAIEYVLINAALTQQVVNDTYAVIYTGILHTHLKILILKVRRIGTDPKCTLDDNKNELVHCIRDHKDIIKLIEAVGKVISLTYFVQFLATAFCMGATLINMSIANENASARGSVVYAICLVMQILPICYLLNTIAAESNCLAVTIFHTNWFDQSKEFKQLCIFFMHRSQQPIIFYAGKMLPVTLDTFVSIIKGSFSVYTLLSNMDFAARFNSNSKGD